MTQTVDIQGLLSQAAGNRGILLSRRELVTFHSVSVDELKAKLRQMGQHHHDCGGGGSKQILGEESHATLGHACAWIDAGAIYEELVEVLGSGGPVETIFCVDPWAAQLRSRAREIAPEAKWILISDFADRKADGNPEYWEQMESWIDSLSFTAILPIDVLETALSPLEEKGEAVHLEKPGAWRWRRILQPPSASLLFLVRYSGSLLHLKVFLDSLARQKAPKGHLHCILLLGEGGEDWMAYRRWFSLAHPDLPTTWVRSSNETDCKLELNLLLAKHPDATLVLIGDHAILSDGFAKSVLEGGRQSAVGLQLSVEASAHILTGNLDPIPNYDSLLKAFAGEIREGNTVCARILAPETWNTESGDPVSRILPLTQEPPSSVESPFTSVLQLADLP